MGPPAYTNRGREGQASDTFHCILHAESGGRAQIAHSNARYIINGLPRRIYPTAEKQ